MNLIRFATNRVWRVYRGGAGIDRLKKAEHPGDGSFPEEWIASTVPARNPRRNDPAEGISRVLLPDGTQLPFDRLLAEEADHILGPAHVARFGKAPGFLTKLLDSAIRLPVQAHPDRAAAKRLFRSDYGKTEAWLVLGGRRIDGEEPYLLMGFNEKFDYETFRREALAGEMTRTLDMMHRWPIVPGEVILIPGGLPHAIGSGVLLQEIMEPSDWVIQPETRCGETSLSLQDRFGGLSPEKALEVFDFQRLTRQELAAKVLRQPVALGDSLIRLLNREETGYFGALKLELAGSWRRPPEWNLFMAGTVISGCAEVAAGKERMTLSGGDTFAVAAGASPEFHGEGNIIFALPPSFH